LPTENIQEQKGHMDQNKSNKTIFNPFLMIVLAVILVYLVYSLLPDQQNSISINFFDVGQGDATLIEMPQGQKVLIDGGPNDSVVSKIDKSIVFYNRKIDAIVLTHPHADHLAGLLKTVESYEVKKVYLTGVSYSTPEYQQFIQSLQGNNIPVQQVVGGDYLDFGQGIKLNFVYPGVSMKNVTAENVNNSSIVTQLVWGKKSALFTGDLEKDAQISLISQNLRSDLLKVPHHCSSDALDSRLVTAVSPKYALISVGKDNKFGHPSKSCLNLLKSAQIFRTDYDGDVTFMMTQESLLPSKN